MNRALMRMSSGIGRSSAGSSLMPSEPRTASIAGNLLCLRQMGRVAISPTAEAQNPLTLLGHQANQLVQEKPFDRSADLVSNSEDETIVAKEDETWNGKYEAVERGSLFSLDYRIYFKGPNGFISPWHDIPLYANQADNVFNMIVEIPRWSNAKMEVATDEPLNPIKQAEAEGKPRFVYNIYPHRGYIWNYGSLPQTWEDPHHVVPDTGAKGDNDPIDVVEIGSKVHSRGAVVQVKVLGTLALIDEGETDWKLVAIDVNDPVAPLVDDIDDVEKHFPGLLASLSFWSRVLRIPSGKPENRFAPGGEYKDRDYAHRMIRQAHEYWKALIKQRTTEHNTFSRASEATHQLSEADANLIVGLSAAPSAQAELPSEVDEWRFVPVRDFVSSHVSNLTSSPACEPESQPKRNPVERRAEQASDESASEGELILKYISLV